MGPGLGLTAGVMPEKYHRMPRDARRAPTLRQRIEAACVVMAVNGRAGVRTRLTLMHPEPVEHCDEDNCRRIAAAVLFTVLDGLASAAPRRQSARIARAVDRRLCEYFGYRAPGAKTRSLPGSRRRR